MVKKGVRSKRKLKHQEIVKKKKLAKKHKISFKKTKQANRINKRKIISSIDVCFICNFGRIYEEWVERLEEYLKKILIKF